MKTISEIPRKLNKDNIDIAIENYKILLSEIPLKIEETNIIDLITRLKRGKLNYGPWKDVSIFEAANRIMTDLVILFGAKQILDGDFPHLFCFKEFIVELGNENNNLNDITRESNWKVLKGEAFNVATSFFNGKKSKSIQKLKKVKSSIDYLIILCNSDSHKVNSLKSSKTDDIEIITVDVKF